MSKLAKKSKTGTNGYVSHEELEQVLWHVLRQFKNKHKPNSKSKPQQSRLLNMPSLNSFRCNHCRKYFTTQQRLNNHKKNFICKRYIANNKHTTKSPNKHLDNCASGSNNPNVVEAINFNPNSNIVAKNGYLP